MRTKEAEVWVRKKDFDNLELSNCNYWLKHDVNQSFEHYRAKIIVELPEKKIEITESELEEALRKGNRASTFGKAMKIIKQQLGFTE